MKLFPRHLLCFTLASALLSAQSPAPGPVDRGVQASSQTGGPSASGAQSNGLSLSAAANYTLGPDDAIVIRVFEADELSDKPIPIAADGFINVPMVGRVHAGGLKVEELQAELTKRFARYLTHPQVTVFVSDFRSQPVSVTGAVLNPGTLQLRGQKNVMEVISMAGGLRNDAGSTVTITRPISHGELPLKTATKDPTGQFTTATVNVRDLLNGKHPEQDVIIEPNDMLSVPKAPLIYVLGEVGKPGGFVLDDHDSLSSLQCLALAGGPLRTANAGKAKILRLEPGSPERKEIPANLSKIMAGKMPDVTLHADDILFVPNNLPKSAGLRAAESAVQIGTGLAIWRF